MNIDVTDDIECLKDGSIDYNYYSSIGRQAKNREIKVIWGVIQGFSMRPVKILPVVAVLTILNFVL